MIVGLALLIVAENFVSLGSLLEAFLGGLIARILVRVVLYREAAIRFLYVVLG